jgi:sugar lactone lactonase YvrE
LTGGLHRFQGVAVDSLGNVFISDSSNDTGAGQLAIGARIQEWLVSMFSVVPLSVVKFASLLSLENLGTLLAAASLLVLPPAIWAQTAHVGYVATVLPANGLVWPSAVAVDAAGDVFIADQNTGSISELPAGATSLVVIHTGLTAPKGIAVDSTGNLYVSQPGSVSLTVYPVGGGNPTTLGSALDQPIGLALDGLGNIYVADSGDGKVKKIAISNGTVTPVGTGWSTPFGVALDAAGNLYVADQGTYSVAKVTTASVKSTVMYPLYAYGVAVDPSGNVFSSDSVGYTVQEVPLGGSQQALVSSSASIDGTPLNSPEGMAVDSAGSVYLADLGNGRVIKLQPGGVTFPATAVSTASSPVTLTFTFNTGGVIGVPGVLTQGATGLDFSDAGTGTCTTNGTSHSYSAGDTCTVNVVFTPQYPTARLGAVLLMDGSANVLATAYLYGGGVGSETVFNPPVTSTPHNSSLFNDPVALVVDGRGISAGNIYIVDEGHHQILKADPSGNVTVFAGTGVSGFSGDGGPAISAKFNTPSDIVMDGAGNLYVADDNNYVVRKIDTKGKISTVAGIGGSWGNGASGGLATATRLGTPAALAFDPQGNLYIVDYYYSEVRKVNHAGIMTTVAGTGVSGYTGDGGPATAARLNYPLGARTDDRGNLYISDTYNNLIRKVNTAGTITTVAGTYNGGVGGYSGDGGPATSARIHTPYDLAIDAAGELFICDSGNSVLRRVDSSGSISTYSTPLSFPEDAVVDGAGNLALVDSTAKAVVTISRTQPATLNFGSLDVGSTSSAQSVNVSNIGNAALTFPAPSTGFDPSISSGFFLSNSSTCPQISSSSSPATLAVGASCTELISFTPTAPGSISGSLVMTDDSLNAPGVTYGTQTIPLTGTAVAVPLTATTAIPSAALTQNYASTPFIPVTGSGGTGTLTYSVSPALAAGLSFSAAGTVSGTPTAASATTTYTVTVTDTNSATSTATFSLTVGAPITATTVSSSTVLTGGQAATAFTPVTASGGTGTLTYSVAPALPAGLGFSAAGAVSGTPTAALAATNYAVTVTDANGATGTANFSLTVSGVSLISNVGTAAAPFPFTLTFTVAGTVSTIKVLTQGAANLDFTDGVTGDTCSGAYSVAGTCAVNVVFTPRYPGLRLGAVQLADSSGNILATAYVQGVGTGPQIAFSKNNVKTTLGSFDYPISIALDGSANVFLGDSGVREIVAAGGYATVHTLGGGYSFTQPAGVALDGAGNLIVADYGGSEVDQILAKGGYTTVNVLANYTQFLTPNGVAVDGSGNIFVTDQYYHAVYEMVAASGYATVNTLASSFSNPNGVAVDGSGNVYVADTGHNAVKELVAVAGVIPNSPTILTLGGGFSSPNAVAVGANGAVFVADSGHSAVKMMPAGCASSACVSILGGGFSSPFGVALSGNGNLFLVDYLSGLAQELNFSSPPSLSFPNTNVGANSSATALSISNGGNAALTLAASGLNAPTDYLQVAGGGTPVDCANNSSVAAGASCNLSIAFKPLSAGAHAESFGLTDQNLNVTGATQAIPLSGTGVALPVKLALSGVPAQISSGANLGTATVDVESAGSSVVTSSSASITVTVTGPGGFSQAVTGAAVNGVFSAHLSSVVLSATGSYTVTATSSSLTSAIAAVTVNSPTTIAASPLTASYSPGSQSVTLGALVTSVSGTVNAGTVTFTVLGGTTPIGSSVTSGPVTDGVASVAYTLPTVTATGTYTIRAVYNAGGTFATSTDSSHLLTVAKATATVTPGNLAQTYTGSPLSATAATNPASLTVGFTYNGSATPPTAPGSYAVVATINDLNYAGTATGALVIAKAAATITLASLAQTYSGSPFSVTATTNPASLTVGFTYNGSATPPTAAGSYAVVATINEQNYAGTATGALVIAKAAATITLGSLAQTYTGSALTATATTNPASLTVGFTYNGSATPPGAAGSYTVVATINDQNYAGTASGVLVIAKAEQSISFTPLASPVNYMTPIALSATGGASGNPVVFTVLSGPGSVSGSQLIVSAPGTLVIAANRSGSANYAAAPQVTQTVVSVASGLTSNVSALHFGNVPLGAASPSQTVIVSNPNGYPVTGATVVASGDFSAASNCPAIAGLGTCSINVTFTPTASGTRSGTLTTGDAQWSGQLSAVLSGTGAAPGIQFSTAALDFGSVLSSTTSIGQTVTIQNTGTTSLLVSRVATTGDFSTTGNCAVIPAGSNCSLSVTFTPAALGVRTGTVTLTDNVGGSTGSQTISLAGMGALAGATLTPSAAAFPSTLAGSTGFLINATLTNTGTAPLTGIGVSILGDFTQANTCQGTLAAGSTCIVSVKYAPTVAGAGSGTLTVIDNLGSQIVSLAGTGVVPGASLSSSQLMFGGQLIDTSSLAQTVVFANTGSTAVNIGSVVTSSNFTDSTNCGGSVAPGASCSVNVIFTPTAIGPLSGTVTITDGAGTQVVSLEGQGTHPGLAVSPSFEIFGAQVAGTTSEAQTLTVTNTGTAALTLNPITVSNNLIESDQCPTIFQPGARCTVSLSFSPTSTGTLSGSMVIGDASGLVSTLVTATGQGTLPGIATSPSTLSFGSLSVGTTSHGQTVTVTNTGTAPLQIGAVSGTGDFAETDTCSSQTIAAGSYCVISVTMTPTTVGTRTGAVQFNDSVDGLHVIALSGMGQQAGVSVTPTSLAFGSAPIVSPAQASSAAGTSLSVTISNTGGAPLELGGFSTQGDFTEADNCGASVAPASTCTLTVKFAPTALGHRTGTLTITDNAGGGSQRVSLEGDGSPAGLILRPPVINFGVQPKGATSKAQTATLSNNTGQAISDLAILASGEYSETDNCGAALANAASCTLNITVTPATVGAVTGTVAISGGGVFASISPFPSSRMRGQAVANAANSTSNVGVVATLADTNGSGTAASQLAFGAAPTPIVAAGGDAGSSVTVLENDSNGNLVGAADTITLTVTSPSGTAKTYTATASGGIATFNLSGNPLTVAGVYRYSVAVASNASIKPATTGLTVNAGAAASVVPTAGSGQSSLTNVAFGTTLQVVVTDSYGNPVSGVTVTFAAPAAGASATLSSNSLKTGAAGAANVTATANGTAGVYTVTAAASGATLASFSLTNSQVQSGVDFSLNPGNVNGQGPSQTVIPGGTATYSLTIVPTSGTNLPASTTLTVTGMPAGATASVPTSPWTRLASNSWSFPASTSFTGFALTIQTLSATALLDHKDAPAREIPPVLWGILLLPFVGGMRRMGKRLGKTASILMVMVVGLTAAVALGGCGSSNGFFGHPQKTYTVTVTATSGTLSHSTNLTLIVE